MKAESNYVLALRKMQQDKTAANPNPPKTNQHEENCYKVDGYLQQNPFCAQICVDNSGEGRPAPVGVLRRALAGRARGGGSAGAGQNLHRSREATETTTQSPSLSDVTCVLRALKMTDDGRHARTPR